VSFAAITLSVASQRVIPNVSIYFVIDSVRKLLDTPSYDCTSPSFVKKLIKMVCKGETNDSGPL
jgi:hypothetical protein